MARTPEQILEDILKILKSDSSDRGNGAPKTEEEAKEMGKMEGLRKIEEDRVKNQERLKELRKEELKDIQQELEDLKLIIDLSETKEERKEAEFQVELLLLEQSKKRYELEKQTLDLSSQAGQARNQQLDDELDKLKEISKEKKKSTLETRKSEAQLKKFEGTVNRFGLSAKFSESTLGKMTGGVKSFAKTGKIGGMGMKSLAKGFAGLLNPANLAAMALEVVLESTIAAAKEFDKMRASLNRLTGQGSRFAKMASHIGHSFAVTTVRAKELEKSFGDLFSTMTDFGLMTEQQQADIAVHTSEMELLGIQGQTTAKIFNIFTKSLGKSAGDSKRFQREIAGLAIAIGTAPAKMAQDFAAAGPQLAKFGNTATEQFKKLAIQAKATGMEMNSLISQTEKFETFEGAAQAAAGLTAVLGKNIDATKLLTLEGADKIKYLRETVRSSGIAFNSLNRFDKQLLATKAGLSSVAEAARQFGQTDEAFDRVANASRKSAEHQAALNEVMKDSRQVMDKFTMVWERFALTGIAQTGIELLGGIADALLKVMDAFGGAGGGTRMTFAAAATGTDNARAIPTLVGEGGTGAKPEILVPPAHSSIINNSNTTKIVQAMNQPTTPTQQTVHLSVQLDGKDISKHILPINFAKSY